MIRRCVPFLMTFVAVLGGPRTASGQLGPLLDWIHEMSGPKFVQWGATFSLGYQPGLELDTTGAALLVNRIGRFADDPSRTALSNRAQVLQDSLVALSGPARYRAVLVDEFNAELDRINRELARQPEGITLSDTVFRQLTARTERLLAAMQTFHAIDALDRGNGIRGRLAITGGSSALSDATKEPDTAAVNVITVSPTAEYLFSRHFAFETGLGMHYFFGDIEPFWSVSMPLLLVARPLVTNPSRFLRSFRINFGANIFAPLGSDAFEPIATIPGTGFEWVWTGFLSLDFPIGR